MSQENTLPKTTGSTNPDPGQQDIELLYRQQKQCERSRQYLKADLLKKQISSLKLKQGRIVKSTIKERQQSEKSKIENVQDGQLVKFNQNWDKMFTEMERNGQEMEKEMTEKHRCQLEIFEKELLHYLQNRFKESSDLLTLRKTQQGLAKRQQYTEAYHLQKLIQEVQNTERHKYSQQVQRKIKHQVGLLKQKQDLEMKSLKQKITQCIFEKKRQYDRELDKLNRKYLNVRAELDFQHNQEMSKISRDKVLQKSMLMNSKSCYTLRK